MRYVELTHFSHPQHMLKLEYTEVPFKCDGCEEVGIGSRYKCSQCDYDLHMHCAVLSPSIRRPFYSKCSFQFMCRPPGNIPRYCNACEKDVSGFVYHCRCCGFDLLPCCAKLPVVLNEGEVKLYLYRKVRSACHRCGRKGRSRTYRSNCKEYNLHVACAREMLFESWHDLYLSRPMKGARRIPSLEGTLVEGHHHRRRRGRGRAKKCCEVAGLALLCVVSAVLGDPTSLIVAVIASLISN